MENSKITKAINNLGYKRIFSLREKKICIAFLLRDEDTRPLAAPWWKGKEVVLIGGDIQGNFFLRHCDGSVRYWDHQKQSDEVVAKSVAAFVESLTFDDGLGVNYINKE